MQGLFISKLCRKFGGDRFQLGRRTNDYLLIFDGKLAGRFWRQAGVLTKNARFGHGDEAWIPGRGVDDPLRQHRLHEPPALKPLATYIRSTAEAVAEAEVSALPCGATSRAPSRRDSQRF